jgi:hypothetical protein
MRYPASLWQRVFMTSRPCAVFALWAAGQERR